MQSATCCNCCLHGPHRGGSIPSRQYAWGLPSQVGAPAVWGWGAHTLHLHNSSRLWGAECSSLQAPPSSWSAGQGGVPNTPLVPLSPLRQPGVHQCEGGQRGAAGRVHPPLRELLASLDSLLSRAASTPWERPLLTDIRHSNDRLHPRALAPAGGATEAGRQTSPPLSEIRCK